jgi:hypothetical protein
MGSKARRRSTVLLFAALVLSTVVASAGCGAENETQDIFEGEPVELGELQWNVVYSRFLNPYDTEDRSYLVGQPKPPADATYLGIFVSVENKDKDNPQPLPSNLTIEDTQHEEFEAIPSDSDYALDLGSDIGPEDEAPALDSTARVGPVQGSLVLFLIPDDASENRPLELVIPGQGGPATVELDL